MVNYTGYRQLSIFDLMFGWLNGDSHRRENLPKTDSILFHLDCLTACRSFFSCSMPVSSLKMALSCVPSIMTVNTANRSASKIRKRSRTTVAGGEKVEHSFHSCLMHKAN